MTWVYFYFMRDEPERVREVALQHAQYWREMGTPGSRGGPFSDRSGGLIIFESPDEETAKEAVANDPFQLAEVLEQWWLKAWVVAADN
jgi:hypothetical protein